MKNIWLAISCAILLFGVVMSKTHAGQACFDSRPIDTAKDDGVWAWHHYAISYASPINLAGRNVYTFNGYGWNNAPTPAGSTDLVPFSGTAVQDNDGSWRVTIIGTLWQESQPALTDGKPYYIISENWHMDPTLHTGDSYRGNLTKPFTPQYHFNQDDATAATVWRVDCGG